MDGDAIDKLCCQFKSGSMPPTIVIADDYWVHSRPMFRKLHTIVKPKCMFYCAKLIPVKPQELVSFFETHPLLKVERPSLVDFRRHMLEYAESVNGDVRQYTKHFMDEDGWGTLSPVMWSASRPRTIFEQTKLLSTPIRTGPQGGGSPEAFKERTDAMQNDPDPEMSLMMLHENAPVESHLDQVDLDQVANDLDNFSAMSMLTHQASNFRMIPEAIAVCANTIHRKKPSANFTKLPGHIKKANERKREANRLSNEQWDSIVCEKTRLRPFPDTDLDVFSRTPNPMLSLGGRVFSDPKPHVKPRRCHACFLGPQTPC
jgi:hypothetical protein